MSYQLCRDCILDSNIPGISFNDKGVCSFCDDYGRLEKTRKIKGANQLEKEFMRLVTRNSTKAKYDCLCLYSGGKDSTNMLYNLAAKLKLRVLAFTLDNWFLSAQTYSNISKVVSQLKVDHVFYKPDWDIAQYMFKAGITGFNKNKSSQRMAFLVGHVCWPCFVMISLFSIKTALERGIPNIVVGTTPGQLIQKKDDLLTKYNGILDVYKAMVKPFMSVIDRDYLKRVDLTFLDKVKALKLRLLPFYEFFKYDEGVAFKTAEEKLGWVRPKDTDSCSTNCLVNALGIAIHKKHYKVSPYLIPLAHDVRAGLVKREDALKAVNMAGDEHIIREAARRLGVGNEV